MPGDLFAPPPHALDLGRVDGARPAKALGDTGAEARIVRIDPGAMPAADFVALQDAENFRPCRRIAGIDARPFDDPATPTLSCATPGGERRG